MEALAERCMADYDEDGWRDKDYNGRIGYFAGEIDARPRAIDVACILRCSELIPLLFE